MSMRVDLLRHGEVAGGARLRGARSDDRLTEHGWSQLARMTGEGRPWALVVTSPQARCLDFAGDLTTRAGIELRIEPRFSEYDFGIWDGRRLDDIWAHEGDAFAAFLADPDSVTPVEGESAAHFRNRVRTGWTALVDTLSDGQHVLLLAHGGVLRQIIADTLAAGQSAHSAIEWPHAAMTRIRVHVDTPGARPHQSMVFHGLTEPPDS